MLSIIYKIEMNLMGKKKLYGLYYMIMSRLLWFYKIYLQIKGMVSKKSGVNNACEHELVVSLTTFSARIRTTRICLETIMNQSVKPKRIVLWLAEEEFTNKEWITRYYSKLIARGLEIKYCDNLRSHKKYFYAMKEYPNATVITLDDDVYYPSNTIKRLLDEVTKKPHAIVCNIAKEVKKIESNISPYNEWASIETYTTSENKMICPIGVGGVLYPPHSLHQQVFEKEDIVTRCFHTDDLWLNAMARMKGTEVVCLGNYPILFCVGNSQKQSLGAVNCNENRNDVELKNILDKYPESF